MNFSEIRLQLRDNLLKVSDNVMETFVHPEAMSEINADFPYITMVFGQGDISGRRVTQQLSIIGFVKGDIDTIPDQIIKLKNDIYNSLYNKEPKVIIETQDLTNLFQPFGLDAGIAPPYGGVRFECMIPNIIYPE